MTSKIKAKKMCKNKMKTRSSAKKRFKLTGSGKYRYKQANKSHLMTEKKTSKQRRQSRKRGLVDKTNQKTIDRLIIQ
jgi:large subunit ribosomal protein L35